MWPRGDSWGMHHSFLWVLQPSVLADGGPNSRVSIKGGGRRLGNLGLKEEAARRPRLQVLSVGTLRLPAPCLELMPRAGKQRSQF